MLYLRWTIREWATDAAASVHRCTTTCADHESRPTVADRWHIAVTTPGGRLSWLMHFDTRLGLRRLYARPGSLDTSPEAAKGATSWFAGTFVLMHQAAGTLPGL